MEEVFQKVLSKIRPGQTEQQRLKVVSSSFLNKLNSQLKDAQAALGGSGAKGTWLSGNHDIDVFVAFDYHQYAQKSAELSNLLQPLLKKALPGSRLERLHGSRDYFRLVFQGFHFEVIPILKLSSAEKALNITDVSLLHVSWVNKHTQRLKDEILLAKQFCKAGRFYGAESYIRGFSGYVLELLIADYTSFEKLLKASQQWEVKHIIDLENYYPKGDALFHLNASKTQSPLVVIDPVDKERNAAAALSLEQFFLFKKKAREFLQKPSAGFFNEETITLARLKEEAGSARKNLVFITGELPTGKEDVVGAKMVKAFEFLKDELAPFSVFKSGWDWDKGRKASFYFFLEKRQLPPFTLHPGPPLTMPAHVKDFKKKNKETFLEGGRIVARIRTPRPLLEDFVTHLLKDKRFKEDISKIKAVKVI